MNNSGAHSSAVPVQFKITEGLEAPLYESRHVASRWHSLNRKSAVKLTFMCFGLQKKILVPAESQHVIGGRTCKLWIQAATFLITQQHYSNSAMWDGLASSSTVSDVLDFYCTDV